MKHWTPRISEAADQAVEAGAQRIVGLVLAPHYSGISIGGYRDRLSEAVGDRADLVMIESWHDHRAVHRPRRRPRPRHRTRTSSLPRTACPSGSSPRATRTRTSCSRPPASSPSEPASRPGRSRSRARARRESPGSARTSSTSSTACTPRASARSSSRRSGSFPTTWRSFGTSTWKRERKQPSSASSSTASSP